MLCGAARTATSDSRGAGFETVLEFDVMKLPGRPRLVTSLDISPLTASVMPAYTGARREPGDRCLGHADRSSTARE
jgi:hypothetical protein